MPIFPQGEIRPDSALDMFGELYRASKAGFRACLSPALDGHSWDFRCLNVTWYRKVPGAVANRLLERDIVHLDLDGCLRLSPAHSPVNSRLELREARRHHRERLSAGAR